MANHDEDNDRFYLYCPVDYKERALTVWDTWVLPLCIIAAFCGLIWVVAKW